MANVGDVHNILNFVGAHTRYSKINLLGWQNNFNYILRTFLLIEKHLVQASDNLRIMG